MNNKIFNCVTFEEFKDICKPTHLSDNGLRVIKGITPAGSNYNRAWKVLSERFNNDSMLINYHLKRLFNLPILNRDEPSKLTILVDGVNNSLPGLNEPMTTWDSIDKK